MAEKNLNLTFFTGVRTVTGANFMVSFGGKKMLVDCGLIQGTPDAETENHREFAYDPTGVDALCVTHAHLDHIGRIPNLVKAGFKGRIYSTPETKAIAAFMLEDLWRVQMNRSRTAEQDAIAAGNAGGDLAHIFKPAFDEHHISDALALWHVFPYHDSFTPFAGESAAHFSVRFLDAGHILGSAMIEISAGAPDGSTKKIIFTGDSGNSPSPLIRDTEPVTGADYLVIDSVYGDRNHEPKDERDRRFEEIVRASIERGGTLVIPTFSLERAQILLYQLNNLVESGKIPAVPVFLDSPLAIKLTDIYKNSAKLFNQAAAGDIRGGDDIFNFPKLKLSLTSHESQAIEKTPDPKIILAGSGMSSGGRIMNHEAMYLPHENNTLLLTGYQAVGTLGRLLEGGAKEVEIEGQVVPVKARVEMINGFSGHKDSEHLLELVATAHESLKKVFVVMGEPKSSLFLIQRIRDYLGVEAISPEEGKTYKIF